MQKEGGYFLSKIYLNAKSLLKKKKRLCNCMELIISFFF